MPTTMDVQVGIREVAEALDRRPATLRSWERYGWLPGHLLPHRNERGWRWWSPVQVEGLKAWMLENDMRPGKGLPHYRPNAAKQRDHVQKQRGPRRKAAPATA